MADLGLLVFVLPQGEVRPVTIWNTCDVNANDSFLRPGTHISLWALGLLRSVIRVDQLRADILISGGSSFTSQ
ncbi:hypothetical protein SCLCIDRAFT_1210532 [Scleroderma citrinum Foug A]|uniref:Uncharacterized protein n=1 Tax=Scleroderma citrinum Foug A TaxID=1036808 RepID=A0A0C3E2N7_9AGAM|nr:hypothetical protein SCLCIDRAFT_1210532 [Scleroderma citrinum Foug A]